MARGVIEDVAAFRVVLGFKILVHQQAATAFDQQGLLGVIGGGSGCGELVPGIALLGIRVIVKGSGECLGEEWRIERNTCVLFIRVGCSCSGIKRRAGKGPELCAKVAEHGVKCLVFMQNEKDVLDLLRGRPTYRHNT